MYEIRWNNNFMLSLLIIPREFCCSFFPTQHNTTQYEVREKYIFILMIFSLHHGAVLWSTSEANLKKTYRKRCRCGSFIHFYVRFDSFSSRNWWNILSGFAININAEKVVLLKKQPIRLNGNKHFSWFPCNQSASTVEGKRDEFFIIKF